METRSPFDEFITQVLKHVRFTEAHLEIRRELRNHLDEATELGESLGHTGNEIEAHVVQRMGDPEELGKRLDTIHRPKVDLLLLSLTFALMAIGVCTLSSGGRMGLQLVWACLGLIPLIGLCFAKLANIRRLSWSVYGFSAAMLLASFVFGPWFEGQPYLAFGPIKIKVVDLSVVLFAISLPGPFCERSGSSMKEIVKPILAALIPIALYLRVGSLYPAFLLLLASISMLVAARYPARLVVFFACMGGLLVCAFGGRADFLEGDRYTAALSAEAHTDFVLRFMDTNMNGVAWAAVALAVGLSAYLASLASSVGRSHLNQ